MSCPWLLRPSCLPLCTNTFLNKTKCIWEQLWLNINLHPPSKLIWMGRWWKLRPGWHTALVLRRAGCVSAGKAGAGLEVLKEGKPKKDVTRLFLYCTLRLVGGKCCGFFTDALEPSYNLQLHLERAVSNLCTFFQDTLKEKPTAIISLAFSMFSKALKG